MNLRQSKGSSGRSQGDLTADLSGGSTKAKDLRNTPGRRRHREHSSATSVGKTSSKDESTGTGTSLLDLMGINKWSPPWGDQLNKLKHKHGAQSEEQQSQNAAQDDSAPGDVKGASGARRKPRWIMGGLKPTSADDEEGGHESAAETEEPRLCILDARTAVSALGNQLVGKGIETGLG